MALSLEQILKLNSVDLEKYYRVKELSKIKIDGMDITGYSTYSYFDAKSYTESPVRSIDGSIVNINEIATFLTPRLRIKFSIMSIDMYRYIMKLIKSKNEHVVECYDEVEDEIIQRKMYFDTEDFPELYIQDGYLLGVLGYEIILNGTNNPLDTINVTYHLNPPSDTGISDSTFSVGNLSYGSDLIVGRGCTFQQETFNNAYKFKEWNTKKSGDGFVFIDGNVYRLTKTETLYAVWEGSGEYTLSYNYGLGETKKQTDGKPIYSKQIMYNDPLGELPTTLAKQIEYNGQKYTPYINRGWYTTPQIAPNSVALMPTSKYEVRGNTTIYQIFEPMTYTITFDSRGGLSNPSPIVQEYGSTIYEPEDPKKVGYVFDGWWTTSDYQEGTEFSFGKMPPVNLTLYAKWR